MASSDQVVIPTDAKATEERCFLCGLCQDVTSRTIRDRDPAIKTTVNWVTKIIRRMTRSKAAERWETKVGNCEVTPQALWHIEKSLMKRDGPKTPTVVHGPSGITYHPTEKVNVIADCLENQFTSHDLCVENHARQVETTVQALLASVSGTPLGKARPCDIHNLANSLKLRRACRFDGIPNECLRHLPRRPLVHLTHLFNNCLRHSLFPKPWK
jgi:hypothetical protein